MNDSNIVPQRIAFSEKFCPQKLLVGGELSTLKMSPIILFKAETAIVFYRPTSILNLHLHTYFVAYKLTLFYMFQSFNLFVQLPIDDESQ